jgi:hypothetical protein
MYSNMYSNIQTEFMKPTLSYSTFAGNYTLHHGNPEEKIQLPGTRKFSRRKSRRNLFMILIIYYALICLFFLMM